MRPTKELLKNPVFISVGAAVALYLAAAIILFTHFTALPERDLIIRFNSAEGIKALGGRMDLAILLVTSGIMLGLNFFLAKELFYKERVLSTLLLWGGGLVALFTLIVTGFIVSIN